MNKIFSVDSKFMQMLGAIADHVLLNLLFLICCIPIVTIGGAKTALFRTMFGYVEGEGSIYRRFFRTFRQELLSGAACALVQAAVLALLIWEYFLVKNNPIPLGNGVLLLIAVIAMIWEAFSCVAYAQLALFHVTPGQLLRNCLLIFLAHPLRCLLIAAMQALPLLFIAVEVSVYGDAAFFGSLGPLWLLLYFSVTANLSARLLRKHFLRYGEKHEKI